MTSHAGSGEPVISEPVHGGLTSGGNILSEHDVVAMLAEIFKSDNAVRVGIGDDAAVLAAHPGHTVVSSDMLVEGVDFELAWASMADVGWKSIAVNVSDIGAMGARPTALVVSLGLPPQTHIEQVRDFARAAQEAVDELAPGASIVGGDLSRAPVLTVSVTAIGVLDGDRALLRAGARPGDVVAYNGELGLAAAGLALLQRGGQRNRVAAMAGAIDAQLRPRPPVSSGGEALRVGATAMIDVSDGLAVDASRIADASGVSIHFDHTIFPRLASGLGWTRVELGLDPWALVFAGGEDFGLLATFPPGVVLPEGFAPLGVVAPRGENSVMMRGRPVDYPHWDHFEQATGLPLKQP